VTSAAGQHRNSMSVLVCARVLKGVRIRQYFPKYGEGEQYQSQGKFGLGVFEGIVHDVLEVDEKEMDRFFSPVFREAVSLHFRKVWLHVRYEDGDIGDLLLDEVSGQTRTGKRDTAGTWTFEPVILDDMAQDSKVVDTVQKCAATHSIPIDLSVGDIVRQFVRLLHLKEDAMCFGPDHRLGASDITFLTDWSALAQSVTREFAPHVSCGCTGHGAESITSPDIESLRCQRSRVLNAASPQHVHQAVRLSANDGVTTDSESAAAEGPKPKSRLSPLTILVSATSTATPPVSWLLYVGSERRLLLRRPLPADEDGRRRMRGFSGAEAQADGNFVVWGCNTAPSGEVCLPARGPDGCRMRVRPWEMRPHCSAIFPAFTHALPYLSRPSEAGPAAVSTSPLQSPSTATSIAEPAAVTAAAEAPPVPSIAEAPLATQQNSAVPLLAPPHTATTHASPWHPPSSVFDRADPPAAVPPLLPRGAAAAHSVAAPAAGSCNLSALVDPLVPRPVRDPAAAAAMSGYAADGGESKQQRRGGGVSSPRGRASPRRRGRSRRGDGSDGGGSKRRRNG
jgi:hypothetical protein